MTASVGNGGGGVRQVILNGAWQVVVMKSERRPLVLAVAALFIFQGCALMRLAIKGSVDDQVRAAIDQVRPALVHIRPVKEVYLAGKKQSVVITGSGVIISPEGYVLTNNHVAEKSRELKCTLFDKSEVYAEVVGTDPYTDIAVLKIDPADIQEPLPWARLGNSDTLRVGEQVMAMGSPHGLSRSVSVGALSATDRYFGRDQRVVSPYHLWIQTDAAINPGNSGGPLVNLNGEVVGINSRAVLGANNLGFAIPINIVKDVSDKLIADGEVARSWIGVELQKTKTLTTENTETGVLISSVDEDSPAQNAGIRTGDIMVSFDGHPVSARFEEELPAVRRLIAQTPVGKEVTVEVKRNGETTAVVLTTDKKGKFVGQDVECPLWGFAVREVTEAIARENKLGSKRGVFVSGVQAGSPADRGGLSSSSIVLRIDGEKVTDIAAFTDKYEAAVEARKRLVLLEAKHGPVERFVLLRVRYDEEESAEE